jgi:hypothetical protein
MSNDEIFIICDGCKNKIAIVIELSKKIGSIGRHKFIDGKSIKKDNGRICSSCGNDWFVIKK